MNNPESAELIHQALSVEKPVVRPALFIDRPTLRSCSQPLRNFLVGLCSDSYQSAVVCPPDSASDALACPSSEIIHYPFFRSRLMFSLNKKMLLNSLTKFKPTVLHCMGRSLFAITRKMAQQLDIPYVLNVEMPPGIFGRKYVTDRSCAAVTAVSKKIADKYSRLCTRAAKPLKTVNMGVFVEEKCSCFTNPNAATSIIISQRLEKLTNFIPLLKALRHLYIDGYDFIAVIIGKGPAERKIYQKIMSLGLTQIVNLIGPFPGTRTVLSAADIFIQPAPQKGFNYSLLEAASTGSALAVSNRIDCDYIIEGRTALQFDPTDQVSIYSTLQKMLNKHEYSTELAQNVQQYLRDNYSVSKMTQSFLDTYSNAQIWYRKNKTLHNPASSQ